MSNLYARTDAFRQACDDYVTTEADERSVFNALVQQIKEERSKSPLADIDNYVFNAWRDFVRPDGVIERQRITAEEIYTKPNQFAPYMGEKPPAVTSAPEQPEKPRPVERKGDNNRDLIFED